MGNPLTTGTEHSRAFAILALLATLVSTLASVIMLGLIGKMGRWNGHLLLITTMTMFQTLYDISFYSAVIDVNNKYITIPSNVAQIIGGIGSSLTSNIVAGIAFYVIYYRKSFPIFQYYKILLLVVCLTALCDASLFVLSVSVKRFEYLADVSILGFYYYTRLSSIFINFAFALLTMVQIRRTNSRRSNISFSEQDINRLSFRLFYYPLVQAISRSGAAWYERQYGYNFSPDNGYNFSPEHTSNWAFAAQCTMAVSMPVASVGYLVIFLVMQPRAFETLVGLFGWAKLPTPLTVGLLSGDYSMSEYVAEESETIDSEDESRRSMVSVVTVSDL